MKLEEMSTYDAQILAYLVDHPGAPGTDIVKSLDKAHHSSFINRIKRLQDEGLVGRDKQGRKKLNYLTEDGKYLAKRYKEIIEFLEDKDE